MTDALGAQVLRLGADLLDEPEPHVEPVAAQQQLRFPALRHGAEQVQLGEAGAPVVAHKKKWKQRPRDRHFTVGRTHEFAVRGRAHHRLHRMISAELLVDVGRVEGARAVDRQRAELLEH